MAAKILVTGATGTVGRNLVRDLVRKGVEVRAGVHNWEKMEYIKMTGVEPVRLDFSDNLTIDRALRGITILYLITPFAREQIEFTRRMVDGACRQGVEYIVKLSISGAQDVPGTLFTRMHNQSEQYILESGIPYTFIRPNPYMQNFIRYIRPSGNLIYMPMGNAKVSYVDVRDVAAISAEILMAGKQHFGAAYELTGPDPLSMDEIANTITHVIGSHIGYVNISEDIALHIMESLGVPEWLSGGMLELYSSQRTGRHAFISRVVRDLIGRNPFSFDKFVHDYSMLFRAIVQREHTVHLR